MWADVCGREFWHCAPDPSPLRAQDDVKLLIRMTSSFDQNDVKFITLLMLTREKLAAEQRPREAGWAAAAVDAQLRSGECSNFEAGVTQFLIGFLVFLNRQQALTA